MFLFDLLGAALTLLCLGLLGLAGYLAALLALGGDADRDPLALAVGTLTAATAAGIGVAILLGAGGLLRLELAVALLAATTAALALAARRRRPGGDLGGPAKLLLARTRAQLAARPALAIVAGTAVGYEALRGLLRPPLSWDSLMYHLWLAASWLQRGDLAPVLAPKPLAYYGFNPANGSLWLWWWMAPSHGELYVNLAFLPQLLLLGLATGGVARALGAARAWPVAGCLAVLVPTVVRFAATPYVDVLTAAALTAGVFFALRWMERPAAGDALLAGLALGVAAGTKLLGPPFALALVAAVLVASRGAWRRRLAHLLLAAAVAAPLGGFFYLRNVLAGAGPLPLICGEGTRVAGGAADEGTETSVFPRPFSVLDELPQLLADGSLVDTLLGVSRPESLEMGLGPVAVLLFLAALVFPLALERPRRRAALVVQSQIALHLLFWVSVPYAARGHVFANVRYLVTAACLMLAGAVAAAERRLSERWLHGLALAVACQALLLLHAEPSRGLRLALALALLAAAALALLPALARRLCARPRAVALAAVAVALLAAPLLARFRVADRGRALREEFTAHGTPAPLFAAAWEWLDRHGGDGTVAVVGEPTTSFIYPAMGPYLQRRAIYVNVDRRNLPRATDYPRCQPRGEPDPVAWLANLRRAGVRWLYAQRYPEEPFPGEVGWAEARPDLFALRYADETNRIYELPPPRR